MKLQVSVFVALSCACAEAERVDSRYDDAVGTCSAALINGAEAPETRDDAIGSLGVVDVAGHFHAFCSGSLVAADRVLTAKHCVNYAHMRLATLPLHFAIGSSARDPERLFLVSDSRLAGPDQGGVAQLGSDLASLTLFEPVQGVEPLAVADEGLGNLQPGSVLLLYGYGTNLSGCDHSTDFNPVRRAGKVVLGATSGNVFDLMYGDYESYQAHAAFTLSKELVAERYRRGDLLPSYEAWVMPGADGAQPCHGDSGGPVFVGLERPRRIVGVVSWTWQTEHEQCALGAVIATIGRETSSALW